MGGREVGIHCVACPGAGFVRIGSHSEGRMPGISRLAGADDALCEDWLTKWVVGVGSEMVSRTHTLALRLRPTLAPPPVLAPRHAHSLTKFQIFHYVKTMRVTRHCGYFCRFRLSLMQLMHLVHQACRGKSTDSGFPGPGFAV